MARLSLSTLLLSLFLIVLTRVSGQVVPKCTYRWELKVKTGDTAYADTDAKISVYIPWPLDPSGYKLVVDDLAQYGRTKAPATSFFERNQLDIFDFDGPCKWPCRLLFVSDGTGEAPGWYLASAALRIPSLLPPANLERSATVERWLSKSDPPFSLNVTANFCQTLFPGNAQKQSKINN